MRIWIARHQLNKWGSDLWFVVTLTENVSRVSWIEPRGSARSRNCEESLQECGTRSNNSVSSTSCASSINLISCASCTNSTTLRVLPQSAKRTLEVTAAIQNVHHSDIVVRIIITIATVIINTILAMILAWNLSRIQVKILDRIFR